MKRIISLLLVISITVCTSVSVFAADFTDVSGHWAEEYINFAYEIGMINGDGDGRFRPDDTITRAEFVKMLIAAFVALYTDEPISDDLATVDHWASKYYQMGVNNKFIIPTSTPEEQVTTADGVVNMGTMDVDNFDYRIERWEMAYLLTTFSVLCIQHYEELYAIAANIKSSEDLQFKDKGKIATYPYMAASSIALASVAGFITGDENGYFNPDAFGTRAEAVVMINRTILNITPIVYDMIMGEDAPTEETPTK